MYRQNRNPQTKSHPCDLFVTCMQGHVQHLHYFRRIVNYNLINESERTTSYIGLMEAINMKHPSFDTLWIVYTNWVQFQDANTSVCKKISKISKKSVIIPVEEDNILYQRDSRNMKFCYREGYKKRSFFS